MVYPSPKEGDISSDFDVSSSSEFGHESGIHPLSVLHSSLEDIKEENEVRDSDCSMNSNISKDPQSATCDVTFVSEPQSPQRDDQTVKSESDHRKQKTRKKDDDQCTALKEDHENSQSSVKDDSFLSNISDDVFYGESNISGDVDLDLPDYNATEPTSGSNNERGDINKLHPRLRALSQMTDHVSPVCHPVLQQLSQLKPVFSAADITTSSPISPDMKVGNKDIIFKKTLRILVPSDSKGLLESTADCEDKENLSSTPKPDDFDKVHGIDVSCGLRRNTPEEQVHEIQNADPQHPVGSFKVPSKARGVKRPLSSVSTPPAPSGSEPHSTGLTKSIEMFNFVECTPRKQDAKRWRGIRQSRTSTRDVEKRKELSGHQMKRYVILTVSYIK